MTKITCINVKQSFSETRFLRKFWCAIHKSHMEAYPIWLSEYVNNLHIFVKFPRMLQILRPWLKTYLWIVFCETFLSVSLYTTKHHPSGPICYLETPPSNEKLRENWVLTKELIHNLQIGTPDEPKWWGRPKM